MAFGNDVTHATITINQGTGDALLKEYYSEEGVTNELFMDNPLVALVPKKEDVTGRYYEQPIYAGTGQAGSRTFAASTSGPGVLAMAAISGELPYTFLVEKRENTQVASISARLIAESSSSKGSFLDMVTSIADNQLQAVINDTAIGMYRGADINRGRVGGSVAGTTLTFANPADAINFEVGHFLEFASSNSGTTVRSLGASNTDCHITAIDHINATATVAWSGSGTQTLTANNVQVGDFIYRAGDKSKGFNGFTDWIPYGGVTSSDSFLGVNRSAIPSRLAGNYLDGTNGNLEEILEKAVNQVARLGGRFKNFMMPFGQFTALANSQGAKVQLVNVQGKDADIGFEGIEVVGAKGRVVCLPDRNCPSDLIAGIDLNSWKLISADKIVHVWQEDGKVWLRDPSQNGMAIRFYSLGNLVCKEMRNNINIKVNPLV